MAILAIISGPMTKDQYESLRREVNWEGQFADGGLFHAAGFDDAGNIHAADLWQSEDQLNTFFAQRLGPAFERLGLTMPTMTTFPAHNINAYPALDAYRL